MTSETELTVLLGQAGWTRALARSLAADVHLADDLVQDAWLAALQRPPDLGRPVRGWFASVLRHRWLDLKRARARSLARERAAAPAEAWPSSHDVVEKAAVQRELVEAVLQLDEPYRTTVLLRFFEELPQREIARRMGTTSATVNSRLTRALARLRERLARGDGTTWLRVLVPLLRAPAAAPAVALGAGAMKTVLTSAVVVASVLAGFVLWSAQGAEPQAGVPAVLPSAQASTELEPGPPAPAGVPDERARGDERVPLTAEEAPPVARARAPVASAARTVRGRVLDAFGTALAGVALSASVRDSRARCTSGPGGWFEIALDGPAEAILAADERYATVLAASASVHDGTQPIVVVAPRIELSGRTVDAARTPLWDVSLELCLPAGFGAEWGLALDHSLPQRWRARSGADGRFQLAAVPAVEGATLRAALAGFAPCAEDAPQHSTTALEIVLAPPGASAGLVRGVVLDPSGSRAEGARVSAGAEIARTDARGEFTLDVRGEGTVARLIALKAGLLPAVFEPEQDAQGQAAWPAEVVLRLGGPAGTLSGRVLDADGAPIGGAKVWLDDPTPFGCTADARLVAESLLRGDERFWSFERTRADGTFTLDGLLARAYRVQALDPRTLASVESAPVSAADSPVELRLPTHDVHARVAGRVVTSAGLPLAGVRVRLFRITYELEHAAGTDNESEESVPVITGDDGAFEFHGVPRHGVDVIATGDTILGVGATLDQEADPGRIELVASLRLHLQVELDEPRDRAESLRVFDGDGRRVLLSLFHGTGAHASFDLPLRDGRSDVFSVEERAATLVLYRGAEEVARLPLQLSAGTTNLVRY